MEARTASSATRSMAGSSSAPSGWPSSRRGSAPVSVALLAIVLDLKRRREEAWLAARYPGYGAYRARTKALIPFLY